MVDRVRSEQRSPIDETRARWRLEAERSRLAGLIASLEGEGLDRESEAESMGELASASQHEADVGSETFERERDLSMLEDFRDEQDDIESAVARLAQGSYGLCAACHQPIDPDRLEAVPAARYCKACQDRYELGGALVTQPVTPTGEMVVDMTEFLPDDDELELREPMAADAAAGAEEGAVFAYSDAELSESELEDELAAEGMLEDEQGDRMVGAEVSEEAIEDTLEQVTSEAEEASLEELREEEEEELAEEGGETEEQEGDLVEAIRRQFGLEEALELDEITAMPAADEEILKPRGPDEFLCSTCFQVRRRTQLADPVRSRCIDCVNNSAA